MLNMEVVVGRSSQYEAKKPEVLASIQELTRTIGKPPSFREISIQTGVSVATLHAYLQRLREEGLIEWTERSHRSLHLTPPGYVKAPPASGKKKAARTRRKSLPPVPVLAVPSTLPVPDPTLDVGF